MPRFHSSVSAAFLHFCLPYSALYFPVLHQRSTYICGQSPPTAGGWETGRGTAGPRRAQTERARPGRQITVAGKKRRRPVHLHVMVSEEEQALIRERMAQAGIRNMGAYMRKMALCGYVLQIDLAPVRELVSLQRRCSNNLNQVAIHANTYGGIYPEEISALQRDYSALWGPLSDLLKQLSALVVKWYTKTGHGGGGN